MIKRLIDPKIFKRDYEAVNFKSPQEVMNTFRPGSYEPPWSWKDEASDIRSRDLLYFQSLTDDIKKEGVINPIIVSLDGRVWDGHHRLIIAQELGIERVPVMLAEEGYYLA